jgi:hypothetical protein
MSLPVFPMTLRRAYAATYIQLFGPTLLLSFGFAIIVSIVLHGLRPVEAVKLPALSVTTQVSELGIFVVLVGACLILSISGRARAAVGAALGIGVANILGEAVMSDNFELAVTLVSWAVIVGLSCLGVLARSVAVRRRKTLRVALNS